MVSLAFFHDHAAITEILWTLFGLIGILIAMKNVDDANKDIELLKILELNGVLRKIAYRHKRANVSRMVVCIIVTIVGLVACFQKPVNPHVPVTPTSVTITIGLFAIVVLTVMNSYDDRRFRHNLIKDDSEYQIVKERK